MSRQLPLPLSKFSPAPSLLVSPRLHILYLPGNSTLHTSPAIQQPAWGIQPLLLWNLSRGILDIFKSGFQGFSSLHSLLHGDYSSICPVKYFLHIFGIRDKVLKVPGELPLPITASTVHSFLTDKSWQTYVFFRLI